jgi:hypothetical protein
MPSFPHKSPLLDYILLITCQLVSQENQNPTKFEILQFLSCSVDTFLHFFSFFLHVVSQGRVEKRLQTALASAALVEVDPNIGKGFGRAGLAPRAPEDALGGGALAHGGVRVGGEGGRAVSHIRLDVLDLLELDLFLLWWLQQVRNMNQKDTRL